MQLFNRTPFSAGMFVDVDRHGAQTLALVIKATFNIVDGDTAADVPEASDRQLKLAYADVFAGAPGNSSLLYESDANWGRTGTDIAFAGHAYPLRQGDREVDVMLRVGPVAKVARVSGNRHWKSLLGGIAPSDPQPFSRVPMIYENAFGGVDDSPARGEDAESEDRNPVGCGLRARESRKALESIRVPNIEDPEQRVRRFEDRPVPVGFSFVAKAWKPRVGFAGTYDAAWQADRMPLLPVDFDPRFYQAASEGLGTQAFLAGGEVVELIQLTPQGRARFMLPRQPVQASFAVDATVSQIDMHLDVAMIDAVNMKLVLVWHGARGIEGMVDDISWVCAEAPRP